MSAAGAVGAVGAAVTGYAWRTPLGAGIDEVIARLLAGERALRDNPRFPAATYACRVAAVASEPAPSRHRKFLRRMGLLGVEVGLEALRRAGHAAPSDRIGIFYGYGGLRAGWDELLPALVAQEPDAAGAWARGLKLLHPFWMLHHLSNNAHALLSIDVGARGDGATYGGANAGAQALVGALAALEEGAIDVALVVAADTLVEPETLVDLGTRGALAAGPRVAAPYDDAAAGFVPGEAAAALVLEREGSLRLDAACGADGARDEAGAALLASLVARLGSADVIDGASLARIDADRAEREGLAGAAGALVSVQAATGQLGGATSIVQAIALCELLRRGVLPPVAGLVHAAPGPLPPVERVMEWPGRARAGLAVSAAAPGLGGAVRVHMR